MTTRTRSFALERADAAAIDLASGTFAMTLASDALDCSDCDVLSIEGAQFTSRAPLQISHQNDPRATLGSVHTFQRDLSSSPKRLRAVGQIELTGDGPNAEIRRDLAHMIASGHLTGVSVRWEPLAATKRTALPRGHFAHVAADDPNLRKRMGVFHSSWRLLEGSIVAIQADKQAMIGRADEIGSRLPEVAAFYRAMAEGAHERDALAELELRIESLERAADAEKPAPAPSVVAVPRRSLPEELAALEARVSGDLRAYMRWSRGEVLERDELERARRMRARLDTFRRPRRTLPTDLPPAA